MLVWRPVALFCLLAAVPASAQNPDLAAIDREVREALRQWEVPGVAVVIVRRDRVDVTKGFGVSELGTARPVKADTLFPIASCTKSFTSAALAMLVGQDKVAWNDPVGKHLPEFHLSDPNADGLVTVRDLLCHRTGVGSHDYLWYRAPWSQDEMIRRTGLMPLTGQFRSSFAYQSVMFMAAGKIIGKHDVDGWDGFVRRRLFTPLGMSSTVTTSAEAAKKDNLSRGHKRRRDGKIIEMDYYPMPEPNAAGSIHTTAKDLAHWLQFQLGDGTWHGHRLISADAFAETHHAQNIIPSNDLTRAMNPESVQLTYGMGWVISDYRGTKVWSHAGLIDGFRCQFTVLPDPGLAIGLMANLHATKMNLALANRLVDLLLDLPERDWHSHYLAIQKSEDRASEAAEKRREDTRKKDNKPTLPLDAYANRYEHAAFGEAVVRVEGERLKWAWGAFKRDLLPYDGNTFELRDVMIDVQDVTFTIEAGRVTKMKALGVEFVRN
jgi:CubicO group peptidase (beta-lactamase class C family)